MKEVLEKECIHHTRGYPMGATASFNVMSVLNWLCARCAEIECGRKSSSFRLTGDDIIACWTQQIINAYKRNCESIGWTLNDEKQVQSKTWGIFCEFIYKVQNGVLSLNLFQPYSIKPLICDRVDRSVKRTGHLIQTPIIRLKNADLPFPVKMYFLRREAIEESPFDQLPYEWGGTGLISPEKSVKSAPKFAKKIYSYLLNETPRAMVTIVAESFGFGFFPKTILEDIQEDASERSVSLSSLDRECWYIPLKDFITKRLMEAYRTIYSTSLLTRSEHVIRRYLKKVSFKGCLVGCTCPLHDRSDSSEYTTIQSVIDEIKLRLSNIVAEVEPSHKGAILFQPDHLILPDDMEEIESPEGDILESSKGRRVTIFTRVSKDSKPVNTHHTSTWVCQLVKKLFRWMGSHKV
jgi:hypothetical protein